MHNQSNALGSEWTRRSFVQTLGGAAVAGVVSPLAWTASAADLSANAAGAADKASKPPQRYRAVSWWLTWDDFTWPNEPLMDKIRRRADQCAKSGVNCAIIFGAHFRWDWMPIWDRVHDMMRFVGTELHQRNIVLFDHHSSVLTHRPRNREEALNIWRRNRHHVPFYPSNEAAERLEFDGSRLNDWRMLDVETGEPAYMPAYNSEQYCMNNPAFRAAYAKYVKKLLAETAIDGLMSDDGIFYSAWKSCSCQHCKTRFQKQYGRTLPPVSDKEFWGNRRNEAFKDWIAMRYQTCGDFLANVKSALPAGFPLLTCCSSSDGYNMPAYGMSYQDFIQHCNLVLLEMTGSTPSLAGTWDERIPSQLLHLGIASDHKVPCFGLGYGFYPDTAFFIWAFNKFLGSDSWLSTLKGRLSGTEKDIQELADDSELVGEGYRWEKARPQLFAGDTDSDTAVFFSRWTRDYYGQCQDDYVSDYYASCLSLLRANVTYDVVTEIPEWTRRRHLVLGSAACLSADERRRLDAFMRAGGVIIATGPTGHYDQRANAAGKPWLEQYGLACELAEPERTGAFPPYSNLKAPIQVAQCRLADGTRKPNADGWFSVSVGGGLLLWRPERMSKAEIAAAVLKEIRSRTKGSAAVTAAPAGWYLRRYRDRNRVLIHALPAKVGTVLNPKLQNQFIRQGGIVQTLQYAPLAGEITLEPATRFKEVRLHSPDLQDARSGHNQPGKTWAIDLSGISRYFVIEALMADA